MAGIEAGGDLLPQATLDSIRRNKLALKGQLTTPMGGGFRSVNVRLREEFQLYPNLRPAHTLIPGLPSHAGQLRKTIDQVLNEDRTRTGDLGGSASTADFAQALARRVSQPPPA